MKLTDYLGVSAEVLQDYINQGLINSHHHKEFPLVLLSYSRKCQYDNTWPEPVRKCRGLIVREDTEEIVARPFEKFFNLENDDLEACLKTMSGSGVAEESKMSNIAREPDYIYEKMDGFMCTLYKWEGKSYIASKGSFDSPHSKWATHQYHKQLMRSKEAWPDGFTPVFEGLTKNLRIVLDYGEREELVLIGLINIETGEERLGSALAYWAIRNGFSYPAEYNMSLATANKMSLDAETKNVEGYVAVWERPGQTPFRLKIKFLDYLRIHRMVCGVSPKRVLEALMNGWESEIKEWTDSSTPWFNAFVSKWKSALEQKYNELEIGAAAAYTAIQAKAYDSVMTLGTVGLWNRKQWAEEIKTYPEELHSVLFALQDGKDIKPFIWKRIKPMISGSRPMVDANAL